MEHMENCNLREQIQDNFFILIRSAFSAVFVVVQRKQTEFGLSKDQT